MKNYSLKFVALFATMFLFGSTIFAQTKDRKFAVGLHVNLTHYSGDLGHGYYDFSNAFKLSPKTHGAGLSLSYYASRWFDIVGKFSYSYTFYEAQLGSKGNSNYVYDFEDGYAYYKRQQDLKTNPKLYISSSKGWYFCGNMWNGTANLKLKVNNGWLLKEDAMFAPYAIGGVGLTRYYLLSIRDDHVDPTKVFNDLTFYYGGGLNIRLSERFNVALEAGIYDPMSDSYDGVNSNTDPTSIGVKDHNDRFLRVSLGVTYNFGKKQDADNDGIADRKDQCPDTPAGVTVDDNGCPVDTDGDGVADYLDKCPNVAGTVDGCPDKDGDGVADKDDDCPDVAGLSEFKGCPDSDGDGVKDSDDNCPDTPSGVAVDSNGCPVDTDGDGVADYLDKCPNEKGSKDNDGCPEKPVYYERVVYFNFGSSSVNRKAISTLNEVVAKMKELPSVNANIAGHTDSVGSDNFNDKLSNRRANAVKRYLMSKGVDAKRINTVGYGEKNPVDTNDTDAGRAKNRRGEIRVKLK